MKFLRRNSALQCIFCVLSVSRYVDFDDRRALQVLSNHANGRIIEKGWFPIISLTRASETCGNLASKEFPLRERARLLLSPLPRSCGSRPVLAHTASRCRPESSNAQTLHRLDEAQWCGHLLHEKFPCLVCALSERLSFHVAAIALALLDLGLGFRSPIRSERSAHIDLGLELALLVSTDVAFVPFVGLDQSPFARLGCLSSCHT
jgi:hypothetical protein